MLVAEISAEMCGVKLDVISRAGDSSNGLYCSLHASHPAEEKRMFQLPDDFAEVIISASRSSSHKLRKVDFVDFPTAPFFTSSGLVWIASASRHCCTTLAATREAETAKVEFARLFARVDKLRADKLPFLVGDSLTVIDIAVALLVLGTYSMLVASSSSREEEITSRFEIDSPNMMRSAFFQHCLSTLKGVEKSCKALSNRAVSSSDERRSAVNALNCLLLFVSRSRQVACRQELSGAEMMLPVEGMRSVCTASLSATGQTSSTNIVRDVDIQEKSDDVAGSGVVPLVSALSLMFFLMVGIESGTVPSTLDNIRGDLATSTTAITAALQMTEVGKCLVAPFVAHFGIGRQRKIALILAACVLWTAGMIIVGTSTSVIGIGGGTLTYGVGFGAISVLTSPFIVAHLPKAEMHRLAEHIGFIFAAASFGVVVCYAVSGSTLSAWRWNFGLAPILLIPPFIIILRMGMSSKILPEHRDGGIQQQSAPQEEVVGEPADANTGGTPFIHGSPVAPAFIVPPNSVELGQYLTTAASLLRHPFVFFNVLSLSMGTFLITAFATLLPTYTQVRFGIPSDTASYIMAGTVPLLVAGTIVGGLWCRRNHYGLPRQLHLTWITNMASIPSICIFFLSNITGYIVVLLAAMFVVSLNSAPQMTLLSNAAEYLAIEAVLTQALSEGAAQGPHMTLVTARDVAHLADHYNSVINSVVTIAIRVLGTIPGPIVLSALMDHSGWSVQYPFLLVGFVTTVLMLASSLVAWKSCPADAERAVHDFHLESSKLEVGFIFP